MNGSRICRQLLISGRVQGFCYRAAMVDEAERLGVTGWVRNRRNGDVEAIVCGLPEAVEAIIRWARRGPSAAIVGGVQVEHTDGELPTLEIRSTNTPLRSAVTAPAGG